MKKKILALCLVVALAAIAVIGGTLAFFTDTTETVENTFSMGKVKIDLDEAPVKLDDDGKLVADEQATRVKANDYSKLAKMTPGLEFPKDPTIHVEEGSEDSYVFLDLNLNKFASLFWVMAADASEDKDINFTIFDVDDKGVKTLKADFSDSDSFSPIKFIQAMAANKTVFQKIIDKWITGITHTDWELVTIPFSPDNGATLTFRFGYIGTQSTEGVVEIPTDNDVNIKFMDSFQMPASVTQEMIESGTTVGGMENNFNTTKADLKLNFTAYAIQAEGQTDMKAAYTAMFGQAPVTTPAE